MPNRSYAAPVLLLVLFMLSVVPCPAWGASETPDEKEPEPSLHEADPINMTGQTGVTYEEPEPATKATETPTKKEPEPNLRGANPISLTVQFHVLLISGLRLAHRVVDDRTEVSLLLGSATIRGCAIQAPMCESAATYSLGLRRYLTSNRFTGYVGFALFYLSDGIRFTREPGFISDVNLGIHWQARTGFILGLGYSYFMFDEDGVGFELGRQGWISTEIGGSF